MYTIAGWGLEVNISTLKKAPNLLNDAPILTRYFLGRMINPISATKIKEVPHFDYDSTSYFLNKLSVSKFYLEYGSGGSTVFASKNDVKTITVDSDRKYIEAVKEKCKLVNERSDTFMTFLPVFIGLIRDWGKPLFSNPSKERLSRWSKYPNSPWEKIRDEFLPDLVLIDGRFRVACALKCIQRMSSSNDWEILIDDYTHRNYRVVENFAKLDKMVGRMAVFRQKSHIDHSSLTSALDTAIKDYS
jgi:hypothetical protein